MLQIVLLAGKFVFLVILYLFIYRVIRSASRELRTAGQVEARQSWSAEPVVSMGRGAAAPGGGSAPAEKEVWTLVVEKSPYLPQGEAYAFPPGAHALAGRSSDMDIYLEDTFVSSKHALFEVTEEGFQVEDLRSTNGTQVNGADISGPRHLAVGDRVEVGDTLFQVEIR
jgi:FHA domain